MVESTRAQKITVPGPIIMTIIKTHRLTLKHLGHGDMAPLVELIGVAEVALNLSGVPTSLYLKRCRGLARSC